MQTLRNLPLLFLSLCVVLLLSLQGCTGNRYDRSTGERLDDAVITTRVKSNIIAISKKREWVGNRYLPWVLVDGVTISA